MFKHTLVVIKSGTNLVLLGLALSSLLGALAFSFGVPFRKARPSFTFNISGITGGTDSTSDSWLTDGLNPTVHFEAVPGATGYDVVIKDSAGVVTLCSALNQPSSPISPTSCGLSNGTTYKVYITAKPSNAPAANNGFSYTVDNTPPTANTITGITGAGDAVVDDWLTHGFIPTVNWNAFTNAASYDVTIKDSTGTTDICATENTNSTSHTFSSCTLTGGTAYRAYVTAKSTAGFQTTAASNTAFNFTVDIAPGAFSITGITGGTDVLVDSYLTDGGDPTVTYGSSSNAYRYDVVIKDSTGTTTICSLTDEVNSPSALTCGLTDGLTYKAYVTAKSVSGYMVTAASNDGYSFVVTSVIPSPASNFTILGATGGSDSTADNWLTSGTTVTASWTTSYGAQNYSVTIRDATDTSDVCATQNTTATSYTFSGCSLTDGTMYLIKVLANNSPAVPKEAINSTYPFTVISAAPSAFKITGATGGTDALADDLLMNGLIVTANWDSSSGATSYDVTIRNSSDTSDVCATQNTVSTSYNFTGCTLTANTTYTIKVTAKNATHSTPAYNGPFAFFVPNTLTFCPTGSSTAKALVIYDSGGPTGNYSGGENCNFTISPPNSPASIILNFTSFASKDNSDILTIYDGTNTSGTQLGSYKNTTTPPADMTATSGNMYLTWSTGASQNEAGYNMNYRATYVAAGSFSITGVQGGSDVTADNLLTDNSSGVTVVWGTSANAVSYDIVIRNGSNTNDVCAKANTTGTSYNFASCTGLMLGGTYVVTVYAKNNNGTSTTATNSPYSFKYDTRPSGFTITGVTGGTDATADSYLEDGTTATIHWTAASQQTSYDVTIYASDGYTTFCSTTNVGSGSTSYTFSGCTLVSGQSYKIEVIAKNASGATLAANNLMSFTLGGPWVPTSLVSVPSGRRYHTAVWTGSEMIIWGGRSSAAFMTGSRYNPTTDSWAATNLSRAPSNRYYHAAVWTGTEMIIWGGYNGSNSLNSGGRYNPASNSWNESALSFFREQRGHTAVWTGSEMIIWGGENLYLLKTNIGLRYNPTTDSWAGTSLGTNVPEARDLHTAVWTDTEMIIWGGYNGSTPLNTGGKYNPSADSWTTITTTGAPIARDDHAAVWTGTEMIVWGGGSNTNTGGRYDPSTDSWTATSTTAAPLGRTLATAVWTGSEMIVWGGDNGGKLNTGGRYDPSTNTWVTSSLSFLSERKSHTAVWTGSEMIIWGGENATAGVSTNTGYKYNPTTDSWTPTTLTGAPTVRKQHSAVWTGTEMIVWGGFLGGNSGGRYNPSSDSWTATSTGANVPTSRYEHVAVWTGSEMIIWGGDAYVNTGGKYNPSTDSWTVTSTGANVPAGRRRHTAVWTGTEMIVWGGLGNSTTYLNSGGKYNPSSDSWSTTSLTSAPVAREFHTAVWTGTEMIIWAGRTSSTNSINSGGKYNPSSDSWTATSTGTNVPTVRHYHTAVWTGTNMIIWGGHSSGSTSNGAKYTPSTDSWSTIDSGSDIPKGYNSTTSIWTGTEMIVWGGSSGGSGAVNTGGRYNPSTDSWTATSTGPGPRGRYKHSAIWTGTEMIIWGGYGGVNYLYHNTGGKYNPSTDSWTATSTGANVPTARYNHSAVWNGSEMIVWGGYDGGYLNSGGKYNPSTNSWTATSTGANVPVARDDHTAIWTGSEMIVWGGETQSTGTYLNTGGRYNPSTNSWIATSSGQDPNTPVARTGPTAVWTGTEMIIWGGSISVTNTGGKYNPSTDSWTATSTGANVPVARYDHSAIWTGTEMIIWGGSEGPGSYLNTGGKYNPSSNTWSTTSVGANVPSGRWYHSAVWTGTEIIIWGGYTGNSTNTGGKYNPSSDSWTTTSTGANVPIARDEHTAVWTGSQMIIWGGNNGSNYNTGALYDPITDTWTTTATGANVPAIRSNHTAVWTGTNMIIWGGYSGGYLNTGGIYTP